MPLKQLSVISQQRRMVGLKVASLTHFTCTKNISYRFFEWAIKARFFHDIDVISL